MVSRIAANGHTGANRNAMSGQPRMATLDLSTKQDGAVLRSARDFMMMRDYTLRKGRIELLKLPPIPRPEPAMSVCLQLVLCTAYYTACCLSCYYA